MENKSIQKVFLFAYLRLCGFVLIYYYFAIRNFTKNYYIYLLKVNARVTDDVIYSII